MTREELKGKQTPGTWFVRMRCKYSGYATYSVESPFGEVGTVIAERHVHEDGSDQYMAGLYLTAEAGNVANRTGMWPEDLEQRVKELELCVQSLLPLAHRIQAACEDGDVLNYDNEYDAKDAIEYEQVITKAHAILNKKPA